MTKRYQYGLDKSLVSVCGRVLQNSDLEAVRDDWTYDVVDTENLSDVCTDVDIADTAQLVGGATVFL